MAKKEAYTMHDELVSVHFDVLTTNGVIADYVHCALANMEHNVPTYDEFIPTCMGFQHATCLFRS